MTLTEFLLARIAEDERLARQADAVTDKVEDDWQDVTQPITHAVTQSRPQESWATRYGHAYEHISRWDPARVLAGCEAKRRIVELHTYDDLGNGEHSCAQCDFGGYSKDWCGTLLALVLPYADHPDYDGAWHP